MMKKMKPILGPLQCLAVGHYFHENQPLNFIFIHCKMHEMTMSVCSSHKYVSVRAFDDTFLLILSPHSLLLNGKK